MKLTIENNTQTFYINDIIFGIWFKPILFNKLDLKLVVESSKPYDVNGLHPKDWFNEILGGKTVIRSDQTPDESDRFDFLTVENTTDQYIVDTLFKILVKLNTDDSVTIKSLSIL